MACNDIFGGLLMHLDDQILFYTHGNKITKLSVTVLKYSVARAGYRIDAFS